MVRIAEDIPRALDVHARRDRDPEGPGPALLVDHRDAAVHAAGLPHRGSDGLGDGPGVLRRGGRQQDGVVVALDLHRGDDSQFDGAAVVVAIVVIIVVEIKVLAAVVVVCVVHVAQVGELGSTYGAGWIVCNTLGYCLLS